MKISNEIVKQQFVQREYGLAHSTYDNELDFYQLVSSGDVKALSGMLLTGDEDEAVLAARGILSDDKVRNRRYHEIVLVAMISRFCIEEGMEEMESYNLSDFYINKLDKAQTERQIIDVHNQLIMDYARRMKKVKKKAAISPHCVRAMDYVYDHLHERIEITEISEFVGVERSYLSKLFHKEVGQTISDYIMEEASDCQKYASVFRFFLYGDIAISGICQRKLFCKMLQDKIWIDSEFISQDKLQETLERGEIIVLLCAGIIDNICQRL